MKILIKRVATTEPQCRVHFECDRGEGHALWVGKPPPVGQTRHVELEVPSALTLGKEATETTDPPGIRIDQEGVVLIGDVTAIDGDGHARLDLGCGALDLEFAGSLPTQGSRYRVATPHLKVFDCDY